MRCNAGQERRKLKVTSDLLRQTSQSNLCSGGFQNQDQYRIITEVCTGCQTVFLRTDEKRTFLGIYITTITAAIAAAETVTDATPESSVGAAVGMGVSAGGISTLSMT